MGISVFLFLFNEIINYGIKNLNFLEKFRIFLFFPLLYCYLFSSIKKKILSSSIPGLFLSKYLSCAKPLKDEMIANHIRVVRYHMTKCAPSFNTSLSGPKNKRFFISFYHFGTISL